MEADWEVEIGPGAPVIDACWEGLVDLQLSPELARKFPEAALLPGLAEALMQLNGSAGATGVRTSKCDVWFVPDREAIDPYELDASPEEALCAWACYIDLVPESGRRWKHASEFAGENRLSSSVSNAEKGGSSEQTSLPASAISWCKSACHGLSADPLRCCRIDLIVREALIHPENPDIGVTAYMIACGSTSDATKLRLRAALERLLAQILDGSVPSTKVE